jgi:hypothetical protein
VKFDDNRAYNLHLKAMMEESRSFKPAREAVGADWNPRPVEDD